MTALQQANYAMRQKQYGNAIRLYLRACLSLPYQSEIVIQNLVMIQRFFFRKLFQLENAKIAMCIPRTTFSSDERIHFFAQHYRTFAEVYFFVYQSSENDRIVKTSDVPICDFPEIDDRFIDNALEFVICHPCHGVHLFDPDMPNVLIGFLYRMLWGARVVVDLRYNISHYSMDDTPSSLIRYLYQSGCLPSFSHLDSPKWNKLAQRLANDLDGIIDLSSSDDSAARALEKLLSKRCPPTGIELSETFKLLLRDQNHPSLVAFKYLFGLTDPRKINTFVDETTKDVRYWKDIAEKSIDDLQPDALVKMSKAFFMADMFSDASKALVQALNNDPIYPPALREQKNQYYYKAYADWLMYTVENENDWYKIEGSCKRPTWETTVNLCKPFVKKSRELVAQSDLKQYIQASLLLAEGFWKQNGVKPAMRSLIKDLRPLTRLLPHDVSKSLFKVIKTARTDFSIFHNQHSLPIYKRIEALFFSILRVSEWLCLYDVCNWNGLLQLGYLARQKAIKNAYHQANVNENNIDAQKMAVKAALTEGDPDTAGDYLTRLSTVREINPEIEALSATHSLLSGDVETFRRSWPYLPAQIDQQFRDYLSGKTVAIVGPAPSDSDDGKEIDNYDIVVRMNWRGANRFLKPSEVGRRTDMALYNPHTVRLLISRKKFVLNNELSFFLIRRYNHDLFSMPSSTNIVRVISEYPCLLYKSLNAIPAIIFDLLLHGAERIKVFKADFYSTERQHIKGYRGQDEDAFSVFPLAKVQPILANHDLISQISFVRQLFHKNLVETTDPIRDIIQLENQKYIASVQSVYAQTH